MADMRITLSKPARIALWIGLGIGAAVVLGGCEIDVEPIAVNTTADGNDANPGDGTCEMTVGAGNCSLRAAIDEANVGGELASINVPQGTYNLSGPSGDDANDSGDLDISGLAVIIGAGSGATIDAGGTDRALDVTGIALLVNTTATNGSVAGDGGGVRVRSGSVVLLNSTIRNSEAGGRGGGLAIVGGAGLIAQSTISDNTAGNAGGGVHIAPAATGEVAMSTVSGNRVDLELSGLSATPDEGPTPLAAEPSGPQLVGSLDPVPIAGGQDTSPGAASGGPLPLIVELDVAARPEPSLSAAEVVEQRNEIAEAADQVVDALEPLAASSVGRTYETMPYVSAVVDTEGLLELQALDVVRAIHPDSLASPTLTQSIPRVNADDAQAAGHTGDGTTIAVIDSGVDAAHLMTAGKVVAQACFAQGQVFGDATGDCPGGGVSLVGGNAGAPCPWPAQAMGCWHGTHVASTAAGSLVFLGPNPLVGVAPEADLIAVNVFSRFTGSANCGAGVAECIRAYSSDIMAGLDHVYSLRSTFDIAAVNMSLGGGSFTSHCDTDPRKAAIDNLRWAGIATVISSGNDGFKTSIGAPACISTAIAVGATNDTADTVWSGSNSAAILDLLAPGVNITAAYPGNQAVTATGTSMASPHVSGAIAALHATDPDATVEELLARLQATGVPVTDPANGITRSRIDVMAAVGALDGPGGGGGIANEGTLTLRSATIASNSAQWGGGLLSSGEVTIVASVIGLQLSGAPCAVGLATPLTSNGYNLASDGSCSLTHPTDLIASPLLGALVANGGPTLTHLPAAGSPLLNRIPNGLVGICDSDTSLDQRGTARPKGGTCDIGSVER